MDALEVRLNPTNVAETTAAYGLAMLDRVVLARRISATKFTWDGVDDVGGDGFPRPGSFHMRGDIGGFLEDLRRMKLQGTSLVGPAGVIAVNFFESLNDRRYSNLNLLSAGSLSRQSE